MCLMLCLFVYGILGDRDVQHHEAEHEGVEELAEAGVKPAEALII